MRAALAGATLAGSVLLAALWGWRTPTLTLVRLKLALDRGDLSAIERTLDARALTRAALAGLVEEVDDAAGAAAIGGTREYLQVQLERSVEHLVEGPDGALRVSWAQLRAALATLQRTGGQAGFRFRDAADADYEVRMRRAGHGWRIVAVERMGEPLLLAAGVPAWTPALSSAPAAGAAASPPSAALPVPPPSASEGFAPMVDGAAALTETASAGGGRHQRRRPFVRQIEGQAWTVQVASTRDATEAEGERAWFASHGEPAFVLPARIGDQVWQRVLVGRYASRTEADRGLARLEALVPPAPAPP